LEISNFLKNSGILLVKNLPPVDLFLTISKLIFSRFSFDNLSKKNVKNIAAAAYSVIFFSFRIWFRGRQDYLDKIDSMESLNQLAKVKPNLYIKYCILLPILNRKKQDKKIISMLLCVYFVIKENGFFKRHY
jgi:hypothetical protein